MIPTATVYFSSPMDLWSWFERHHTTERELWVQIYKTSSGVASVTWEDCVIAALAWGWIDGKRQSLDATSFAQRLTPRRPRSVWSQKNRDHVEKLIAEGRMQPSGRAQVEAAKADGRWDSAYARSSEMVIPQDFLEALDTVGDAKAFFDTLNRANLYTIYYRLHSAKRADTRARRMTAIIDQLKRKEPFH